MLDLLSPRSESEYHTHEDLSIDEAMIPFKGRLRIKQYMKDKPTKWGSKLLFWLMLEQAIPFVSKFIRGNSSWIGSEPGLCCRVVLELLNGLQYTCPKVYMDNYCTSPEVFLTLYNKGVNSCGTARANGKFYRTDLKVDKKSVCVGYYDFQSNGPLLDKQIIHFLSNIHVAQLAPLLLYCGEKDGSKRNMECPPLLPDYQAFMRY